MKKINSLSHRAKTIVEWFAAVFKSPIPVLIDVGCGDGSYYFSLYKRKVQLLLGVDLDRESLKKSKKEADSMNMESDFAIADAHHLPFKAEAADCILLSQVLEHCNDPIVALHESRYCLKRSGLLILDVPWLWQIFRFPHAYILRSLTTLKFARRQSILFKAIYKNLDKISRPEKKCTPAPELQRTFLGKLIIPFLSTIGNFLEGYYQFFLSDFDSYVLNHFRGKLRDINHKNFLFPNELETIVKSLGFITTISGTYCAPPLMPCNSQISRVLELIERRIPRTIKKWFCQICIIAAIKL